MTPEIWVQTTCKIAYSMKILVNFTIPLNYDFNVKTEINPRPAGVFSRTRPAGGGGGRFCPPPLPNSQTNRRSEAGEAAIESPEREDSNAY